MDEILPGVLHWTTFHEGIGQPVHSHFFVEGGALFDPRVPAEGIEEVARHGRPDAILLSNRHHLRHAEAFATALHCPIKAQRAGLHEFARGPDVHPFDFGDQVAPRVTALEVGALTPEDTAFHIEAGDGALLFADALIRNGGRQGTARGVPRRPSRSVTDRRPGSNARPVSGPPLEHRSTPDPSDSKAPHICRCP